MIEETLFLVLSRFLFFGKNPAKTLSHSFYYLGVSISSY